MPGGRAAARELSSVSEGCWISPVSWAKEGREEGRVAMCSVVFIVFPNYLLLGDRAGPEGPLFPPCCSPSRSVWYVSSLTKLGYKLPQSLLIPSSCKQNWRGNFWRDREMEEFELTRYEWCLVHTVPKMWKSPITDRGCDLTAHSGRGRKCTLLQSV